MRRQHLLCAKAAAAGLRPEADIWFDAWLVLDAMIRSADRLLHTDEGAAREQYRHALALYPG